MFDNVGDKIQKGAKILWGISIFCSIIVVIQGFRISNTRYEFNFGIFFLYILLSLFILVLSYISSLVLYGFGEILENTHSMKSKVNTIEKYFDKTLRDEETLLSGGWQCSCGRVNPSYKLCCSCGKHKTE